jgi:hypothetical protein
MTQETIAAGSRWDSGSKGSREDSMFEVYHGSKGGWKCSALDHLQPFGCLRTLDMRVALNAWT